MVVPRRTTPRKCYWFWSEESGTGKSRKAFELWPDAYPKMANKWWDGYQGEKVVILDEFDPEHACLGSHLKKWSDPWAPFIAEYKQAALPPDYDIFVVTSNCSLETLFGDKPHFYTQLLRRFEVHHFNEPLTTDPPRPRLAL